MGHRELMVSPRRCGVRGREVRQKSAVCKSRGACEDQCARASVRVARPGSPVLLQSVSATRRSRAPQAAREGIKGNVLCVSSASFP